MQRLVLLASASCSATAPPASLLMSVRSALEAHAASLSLSCASVEVGSNNSPEQLTQGFDIAAVVSVRAASVLSHDAASALTQKFQNVCCTAAGAQSTAASPKTLSLLFSATPSPHCSAEGPTAPSSIRHFVAWKFRPDAAPAVDAAVDGYLNLPQAMPYFSALEVGRDMSLTPAYSVCLYSTFHNAQAQHAFVHDARRIAFKEAYVKPHLATNGVLVFDFSPAHA